MNNIRKSEFYSSPDEAFPFDISGRSMANDFSVHVGELSEAVFNWAEGVFPGRTDVSMYLKLYSEIGEMIESDGDRLEIADVFIMLMDYAVRKKVDITRAVLDKLEINKRREWATDVNGVNKHVK